MFKLIIYVNSTNKFAKNSLCLNLLRLMILLEQNTLKVNLIYILKIRVIHSPLFYFNFKPTLLGQLHSFAHSSGVM